MKVFVYSTHILYTPHIETDLELMQLHLDKGDTVYRFVCDGHLSACDVNNDHELLPCLKCHDIQKMGYKLLNGQVFKYPMIIKQNIPFSQELFDCKKVEDLQKIYFENFDVGYGIASTIISSLRNAEFNIEAYMKLIKEYYNSSIALFLSTIDYIKRFKPDKVYIYNGRYCNSRAILRACEATNTEYVTHERGANQNRYDLFYDKLPHDKNYAIERTERNWNDTKYTLDKKIEIGSDFFTQRRSGSPKDWHSFTKAQNPDLLPEAFNPQKKNIAIFNSSTDEFASISTDWSYSFFDNQENFVRFLAQMFQNNQEYHFYLRVHPNLKGLENSQNQRIAQLDFPNLTIIQATSPIGTYTLMDNCDKTITFGSTMGVEATFWGKPSILVAQSFYSDVCAYKANSYEEVYSLICADIKPKEKIGAIKYGYYHSVKGTEFKYFKATSLFSGTFKGHDITKESPSLSTRIIQKLLSIRILGKALHVYAASFQKNKLKLPPLI